MSIHRKRDRIDVALTRLRSHETDCRLCPRECGVNRAAGERGYCNSGRDAVVSHALLHYGEEPVLSGVREGPDDRFSRGIRRSGSGTIFFAGCNLKCLFCQNYQLSWLGRGRPVKDEDLAEMMLDLQDKGALNINLVSPTHFLLPVLRALRIACSKGLQIPLVSNSNGYEKTSVLAHLEGIIDIYLPDLKYFSSPLSLRISEAADYFAQAGEAVKEMACQQPGLVLDDQGIARRGLIVRHLVLPGQGEDTRAILGWMARELGASVAVSLMSQYHPCFRPPEDMMRPLTKEEYRQALSVAEELGFQCLFVQPDSFAPDEHLVPDFDQGEPFQWAGKRNKK
ncbi:MAG: radical SAM protein [Candidatus Aminicenantes bacterium]|nr:radical SAM protein [Candidatus Aminicenantes bacterium]